MLRVLFVCIHNSARSQMAEAFLNRLGQDGFYAESAGLEPGTINPLVVRAMMEVGYDLTGKETHSVFAYFKEERQYDVVVKVCDQASGQKCPIFPSARTQLNWSFPDPAAFEGSDEEKMAKVRVLRDLIKAKIEAFIEVFKPSW